MTYTMPQQSDYPPKNELQLRRVTPRKIGLFWDPSDLPKKLINWYFGLQFEHLIPIIRIYDVTNLTFNGKNAHHFYEIAIPYENGHWFVKGLVEDRCYLADLGIYLTETEFFSIFRSNYLLTRDSQNTDVQEFKPDKEIIKVNPKWRDYVSTYSYYSSREDQHD